MKKKNLSYTTLLPYVIIFLIGCGHLNRLPQEEQGNLYPLESTVINYHSDRTKNHYKERVKEFKKDPLNFGDIVFVGNSITEGGKDWGVKFGVSNVKNRGISGDVADGVLKRLDEITYFKPKAIFLLIGINDLYNIHSQKEIPSPEYVGNNILKIIEIIHKKTPKTKIYTQSILPTNKDLLKDNITIVNAIINSHEKEGAYEVIDLNSAFLGEEGLLRKDLTYDGTHLNDEGYAIWVDLVKPLVIL